MEGLISQGLITGMRGRHIAVLVKVTKTKRNNRFVWGQGWLIIGYIFLFTAIRRLPAMFVFVFASVLL